MQKNIDFVAIAKSACFPDKKSSYLYFTIE